MQNGSRILEDSLDSLSNNLKSLHEMEIDIGTKYFVGNLESNGNIEILKS